MAKALFNEVENYLLANWADARLLERSLECMREKYEKVLKKVLTEVSRKHPYLVPLQVLNLG